MNADKYSGGVVGWQRDRQKTVSQLVSGDDAIPEFMTAEAVSSKASIEEILVAEDGRAALEAGLSRDGTIVWNRVINLQQAYKRVVAQSQMASMLKDDRRNTLYKRAITKCVEDATKRLGRPPVVLDIGCGTGLLSMMAASAGAEHVYAVEQWKVMAAIASKVIAANTDKVGGKISVYPCHSADLKVGATADKTTLSAPADIVISEILDSMLLGEGVIPSLSHAYENLVAPEALSHADSCVPRSAIIMAQLIHAPEVDKWQATHDIQVGSEESPVDMARKDWSSKCEAPAIPIPVHIKSLHDVTLCTSPFTALHFDFTPKGIAESSNQLRTHTVPLLEGATQCNAVLFWWKCTLYGDASSPDDPSNTHNSVIDIASTPHSTVGDDDSNTYSTHADDVARYGWQDHWVQCVVPLTEPIALSSHSDCTVVVQSTDMQLCFQVAPGKAEVWPNKATRNKAVREGKIPKAAAGKLIFTDPEPCICGLHTLCSFERRWQLHDEMRRHIVQDAIRSIVASTMVSHAAAGSGSSAYSHNALCLGKGGVMGLSLASELGEALEGRIAILEETLEDAVQTSKIQETLVCADQIDVVEVSDPAAPFANSIAEYYASCEMDLPGFKLVLAEPVFSRMQNSQLWCAFATYRRICSVRPLLVPDAVVAPAVATIKAKLVRFHDLHKNHGTLETVMGFDHAAFDDSESVWHEPLYAYPTWQYSYDCLCAEHSVGELEFARALQEDAPLDFTFEATVEAASGKPNAILMWVDYAFSTAGPVLKGDAPSSRQHVKFLPQDSDVASRWTVTLGMKGAKMSVSVVAAM